MMTEQEYKKICQKLGFDPIADKTKHSSMEDDTNPSKFSVLTFEEKQVLLAHLLGYIDNSRLNRP